PTTAPFVASGSGIVHFQDVLNNAGNTLNLVGSGLFSFDQLARVNGGTISRLQGSRMLSGANATILDGVTVDFGVQFEGPWRVLNGLTLASDPSSTIRIGSDTAPATSGSLTFVGTQTLAGTGDVIFGLAAANVLAPQAGSTLTITPGITV